MNQKKDDLQKYIDKLSEDSSFAEKLDKAGKAWDVALQIVALRRRAGLSQTELARMIGTKQSNIARLESADYAGYTLKTLEKVTKALRANIEVRIVPIH